MAADRDNRARLLEEARQALGDARTVADVLNALALADIGGGKDERLEGSTVLWLARHLVSALECVEEFTNLTIS